MNWIDIICLSLIIIFSLLGFISGFVKSFFKLLAWILGFVGAYFAFDLFGAFIYSNIEISMLSLRLICWIAGFLIPFISMQILCYFLNRIISKSFFSSFNRIGGLAFGFFKSLIACCLLLSVIHLIPAIHDFKEKRDAAVASQVYQYIHQEKPIDFSF